MNARPPGGRQAPRRVVIVGYGLAGARLAERIRERDPGGERVSLTVVGAEPGPAYNRVLLSGVLAGTLTAADTRLHDRDWAARHHVTLRLGAPAVRLDLAARTIVLAGGATVGYDTLVLATGARPWLPPVEGLTGDRGEPAAGVATLRDLDDCLRIERQAGPGVPLAVLGGGVLGVETALGLAGRGARVTLVHPAGHLMERQLDPMAGATLAGLCRAAGVRTLTGQSAVRYYPGEGVKLDDGSFVPAALTVVTAGTRPGVELAARAGLTTDAGIVVDDRLRTTDPRVHAIGDCAQPGRPPAGLARPAWRQAEVLADLLTGADPAARYRPEPAVTRLRAGPVDLTAFGEIRLNPHDTRAGVEVLAFADPARGVYAKLTLSGGDRVIGGVSLGLPDAAARLVELYDGDRPAPADRTALLLGRALPPPVAAEPPETALVCRCNAVTRADLKRAAREDGDPAERAAATRAGTGCGDCLPEVRRLLRRGAPTEGPHEPAEGSDP
ncbi:NAD(P)/FAD-dependent oxidoreductase [Nonomuraea sp. NN258]|uniref:FAD-dependent oxidoreductase n=1 Tax=Nonomuraea antri TaxID=2730852 RepID=UPI0015691BF4|nr:FAD-dependent oxidoreductase [Nonomuraea antri]NRQ38593.1 NAD(P)/FAD-dependent oxidoreductase [Nonomuraea antri]